MWIVDDLKDEMDKENRLTGITHQSVDYQFGDTLTTKEELGVSRALSQRLQKDNTRWAVNNFYQWKKWRIQVASCLMTCLMLWP